jgi:hypothetical protein
MTYPSSEYTIVFGFFADIIWPGAWNCWSWTLGCLLHGTVAGDRTYPSELLLKTMKLWLRFAKINPPRYCRIMSDRG